MANTKDSSFSLTSNKKPEVSLSQESIKINPYNEKRHSSVDIMYEYEYDPHSHDVDAHDRSSSKKSATLCSTQSDSKSSQPSIPSQRKVNREIKPQVNANLKDKEDDHDINQTHDSFPNILMQILSKCVFSSFIHWCPNGKAFEISNPEKFAAIVLPIYFKSNQYSSFKRKLYRWGFRMNGVSNVSYYHDNFLRDRIDLMSEMHCHYSPKELRLKRAKKCIRKNVVVEILNSKGSSLEQSASTTLQVQPQVSDVSPTQQNLQEHLKRNSSTLNVPLQNPQWHCLSVPNFSSFRSSSNIHIIPSINQVYPFTQVVVANPLFNVQTSLVNDFQRYRNDNLGKM